MSLVRNLTLHYFIFSCKSYQYHQYSAHGQVFHCKLRHQGRSSSQRQVPTANSGPRLQFYWSWIGAVASRCFQHPTLSLSLSLSLASEPTVKDLKRGHSMDVRRVDLANWALRTSPKLTTVLNVSSIRVFDLIRDPEIPITVRLRSNVMYSYSNFNNLNALYWVK